MAWYREATWMLRQRVITGVSMAVAFLASIAFLPLVALCSLAEQTAIRCKVSLGQI